MHSTECNDNAHVKMHYNAEKNIECNTCRIRRIVHNASIVRTRSKCKISRMLKNVIENSEMIYNALIMFGAQITRLWGTNHTPPHRSRTQKGSGIMPLGRPARRETTKEPR